MAFEIDLRTLEKNYSIMSAEEFALLRRSDLSPDAAEIYDRVAAIRRAEDDSALEVAPVSSDTAPQAQMANSAIRVLPGSAGLFANTLGFKIDLRKLENDYSIMSAEGFALLRRSDLTPEAAEIYDRVAAIRATAEGAPALEFAPISSAIPRPKWQISPIRILRAGTGLFANTTRRPMSLQRSPVAHTAYPPQPSKLPAPLWHTGIVVLYLLVPHTWWPGWTRLLRALPYNSASFDILGIAMDTAVVAFVCLGLSLRQTPLEQMLGELWTSWKSALRDIAIGLGFWLVARYADRLIYYLTPYPSRARLFPHTKNELLISIFASIVAGVAEELIFRGYLQKQFTARCRNLGAGLLIQAILFALYHGYHQLPGAFYQHFLFGLIAGLLAHWRKSLLPGMIGHAWFDAYWNLLRIAGLK